MLQIDKEKILKLKNGDFSDIHLHEWFTHHDFAYIFATIEGCSKNINYDLLNFISIYAHEYLEKPNGEDWLDFNLLRELIEINGDYPINIDQMDYEELLAYWNKQISRICEQILEKVIVLSSKFYEYHPILTSLESSKNENVRLHCCANGNFFDFLNDKSQRVREVANIRYNFNNEMRNCDIVQRKRIDFLTKALQTGAIECYDSGVIAEPNVIYLCFNSLLFEHSYSVLRFNKDIYNSINKNFILANTLNQLIKDEEINLKEDLVPLCFAKEKSRTRHT